MTECTEEHAYAPRKDYGAVFEPPGRIFHGAGQTYSKEPQDSAFDRYTAMMADHQTRPFVFMAYMGPGTGLAFYDALRQRLDAYEAAGHYVVPQFGFHLPNGLRTMTDGQRAALADGLKALGRPSFVRVGYEMNGNWYDPMYEPEPFIQEFRRTVAFLREQGAPFASLWNMCPGWDSKGGAEGELGTWAYMQRFYPGDAYVDWFSMDLFSTTDITNPHTAAFLEQADAHGKPVMVGEATARYVGTRQASAWHAWFEPFFALLRRSPGIKGHTYINWDWTDTRWPDWGDCRLDADAANPEVRQKYLAELEDPVYFHAPAAKPGFLG